MSANDRIYLRATALQIAGCSAEAFKAWRNRLGLFPETQKSDGWNRYSFTDIFTLALVTELTRRGITAQAAVTAAMIARPQLADLFEVNIPREHAGQTNALAAAVLKKIEDRDVFDMGICLPYINASSKSEFAPQPTCRFWSADSPVHFSGDRTIIVINLYEMVGFLFGLMIVLGTEAEFSDGVRRVEPGTIRAYLKGQEKAARSKLVKRPKASRKTPKRKQGR